MESSNIKCGSQGPMQCLYGSICNETLGFCVDCPVGYRDDTALFIGNRNCGLSEAGMYAIYVTGSIFATVISIWALAIALPRKQSRMRTLLLLAFAYTAIIPFFLLSHWLGGFRFTPIAIVLYMVAFIIANIMVIVYMYNIEKFMGILCNNNSFATRRTYDFYVLWGSLWVLFKLCVAITLITAQTTNNIAAFNLTQVVCMTFTMFEIFCNVSRTIMVNNRLVKSIKTLHGEVNMDSNPIVLEFAKKVEKVKVFGPLYGILIFAIGIAYLILFFMYDSAIPYAYGMFAYFVLTWPILGLRPIFLLRSKLGQHIEKNKSATQKDKDNSKVSSTKDDSPRPSRVRKVTSNMRENSKSNTTASEVPTTALSVSGMHAGS